MQQVDNHKKLTAFMNVKRTSVKILNPIIHQHHFIVTIVRIVIVIRMFLTKLSIVFSKNIYSASNLLKLCSYRLRCLCVSALPTHLTDLCLITKWNKQILYITMIIAILFTLMHNRILIFVTHIKVNAQIVDLQPLHCQVVNLIAR